MMLQKKKWMLLTTVGELLGKVKAYKYLRVDLDRHYHGGAVLF